MTQHRREDYLQARCTNHELCYHPDDVTRHWREDPSAGADAGDDALLAMVATTALLCGNVTVDDLSTAAEFRIPTQLEFAAGTVLFLL
jgi:hypothetical protein